MRNAQANHRGCCLRHDVAERHFTDREIAAAGERVVEDEAAGIGRRQASGLRGCRVAGRLRGCGNESDSDRDNEAGNRFLARD